MPIYGNGIDIRQVQRGMICAYACLRLPLISKDYQVGFNYPSLSTSVKVRKRGIAASRLCQVRHDVKKEQKSKLTVGDEDGKKGISASTGTIPP